MKKEKKKGKGKGKEEEKEISRKGKKVLQGERLT